MKQRSRHILMKQKLEYSRQALEIGEKPRWEYVRTFEQQKRTAADNEGGRRGGGKRRQSKEREVESRIADVQ